MSWPVNAPGWLTARPIAHRGFHDHAQSIVENSLAAARRAIEKTYAIECDVQPSKDGEAIVFHDERLDRLVGVPGPLGALTAREITQLRLRDGDVRIPSLQDFLAEVAGRVPVIVELKSRFDGDLRWARRVAELAAAYAGPLAFESFDPELLCALRALAVARPVGLVAQAHYAAEDWPALSESARKSLEALVDIPRAAPDFLSWHLGDLPHAVPILCRAGLGMPVTLWTVRSETECARAKDWADQIVFEGFQA